MTVLYPNPCYSEACYDEVELLYVGKRVVCCKMRLLIADINHLFCRSRNEIHHS